MDKFDPIPEVRKWKKKASKVLVGKSYEEKLKIINETNAQLEKRMNHKRQKAKPA